MKVLCKQWFSNSHWDGMIQRKVSGIGKNSCGSLDSGELPPDTTWAHIQRAKKACSRVRDVIWAVWELGRDVSPCSPGLMMDLGFTANSPWLQRL